jgi:hypothetical protein
MFMQFGEDRPNMCSSNVEMGVEMVGGKHTHTAWCTQKPSSLFLEKEMSANVIMAIILCHELVFTLAKT